ncbi:MAG: hypothetical protein ABSG25_13200 [Bryobacteraceae bacterium]
MSLDGPLRYKLGTPAGQAGQVSAGTGGLRVNWPLLLFVGGIVAGLFQLWHPVGYGLGPGHEMVQIAHSLVAGRGFSDPFSSMPTGPTANQPPLYPLFLALVMKLFGTPKLIVFVLVVLVIVPVNALVAALMPRVSTELFGARSPGIFAGIFSILSARVIPEWDADCTQLGLIALTLTTALLLRRNVRPDYSGAIAGTMVGILCLMNPMSLAISAPCAGFCLAVGKIPMRGCIRFFASLTLAAALVMLPWLARNYSIWGHAIIRTTLGSALYISNNDCAEPSLAIELHSGCHDSTHPNMSVPEARLLAALGEPGYDHRRTADAMSWIRSHPSRFAWLTRNRFIQFWLSYPIPPAYSCYAIWIITVLSIPGLIWMVLRRERATFLLISVFALYPPIYYIIISDERYRVPILWLSCLAAGYFVSSLIQVWSKHRSRRFAASC